MDSSNSTQCIELPDVPIAMDYVEDGYIKFFDAQISLTRICPEDVPIIERKREDLEALAKYLELVLREERSILKFLQTVKALLNVVGL